MKVICFFLPLIFLVGCASTGYNPHYIVSDTFEELAIPEEPSTPSE